VQLVSKIPNLSDPDPPTSQTDRQTDDMHRAVTTDKHRQTDS